MQLILNAKQTINIISPHITSDNILRAIMCAMLKNPNLKVNLIVDRIQYSSNNREGKYPDKRVKNIFLLHARYLIELMRDPYFDGRFKIQECGNVHAKTMVVDEEFTLTGSYNFGIAANRDNYECAIFFKNNSIARAWSNFMQEIIFRENERCLRYWDYTYWYWDYTCSDWVKVGTDDLSEGNYQVYFERPEYRDYQRNRSIVNLIGRAIKSIKISIYSLSCNEIIEALKNANERGVKVEIIIDKNKNFNSFYKEKSVSIIDELKKCGIIFYEFYESIAKPGLMHQKMIIVDTHIVGISTSNYTRNPTYDGVIIVKSEDLAAECLQYFNKFKSILQLERCLWSEDIQRRKGLYSENGCSSQQNHSGWKEQNWDWKEKQDWGG